MRIAYCTNVRLPSERAHGHQVARVCDALAKLGHEVTIFAPFRENPIKDDYWTFHTADRRVQITHLGSFDPINHWWLPKPLQLLLLNFSFRRALCRSIAPGGFDLLYTRTPALLGTLLGTGIPVVLELHTLPWYGRKRFVRWCNRCTLVLCLTSPMREELLACGVDAVRIAVESDAVDIDRFKNAVPLKIENIPHGVPRVGYAGQIESMGLSKGIPELLDALTILKRRSIPCRGFIAGPAPKNGALLERLKQISVFFDFLPSHSIPSFLAVCDILVYPAPASHHPFYMRDTSPLKIFEYMAAGKPIVTADLPPIRDILDESTAFFCRPGDPEDLARAIVEVLAHPEEAGRRAAAALKKVEHYTWDKRMARIMQAVQRSLPPGDTGESHTSRSAPPAGSSVQ